MKIWKRKEPLREERLFFCIVTSFFQNNPVDPAPLPPLLVTPRSVCIRTILKSGIAAQKKTIWARRIP